MSPESENSKARKGSWIGSRKGVRMNSKKIRIPAVNCHHCKMTIERELGELEGIESVSVDVDSKTAIISWSAPLTWDEIIKTLSEIGYAPEE